MFAVAGNVSRHPNTRRCKPSRTHARWHRNCPGGFMSRTVSALLLAVVCSTACNQKNATRRNAVRRTAPVTEDHVVTRASSDEPEDQPAPETGGTGQAMALDEGKMGKKDSDRAEGQYKMRVEDPQLARQQIDEARKAGLRNGTEPYGSSVVARTTRRDPATPSAPINALEDA